MVYLIVAAFVIWVVGWLALWRWLDRKAMERATTQHGLFKIRLRNRYCDCTTCRSERRKVAQ